MINSLVRVALAAGVVASLSACSSEPSASDISNALQAALEDQKDQLYGAGGTFKSPATASFGELIDFEIANFEKVGCNEDGKNSYICNVSYTLRGGMFGKTGRAVAAPVYVLKASDGWTVAVR